MIQLPSSELQQAHSHNEDWGERLRDPPPEGRAADEYIPSRISLRLVPLSRKKRQPEKDERKRDDSLLVLSHSLLSLPWFVSEWPSPLSAVNHEPPVISLPFSVLDLHVNYLESKSFMCHIHSLQHILMIALCLNFLNYSTSPSLPPSLWAGKCILPFNCVQN